ncbi:MAG TPA: DUF3179 domain-containing (seleno)protein [Chitinophagaceae bacterium]|nr:DUF3179 domain-containing protein [Chitinophagaceae bacterium]MCB9054859.1 DUF3179 domain-containing protein [Chitinophagales bacterium]HRX93579.1 DUF3179 domain-containing (seleno)protein [Chitinophagaceae bacterium]
MKRLFYTGLAGLILFEVLNVYFIMPMPGSQEMKSISIAYFLYSWRWIIRAVFLLMVIMGIVDAFRRKRKWIPAIVLLVACSVAYLFNFKMTAEKMFLQPKHVMLKSRAENVLPGSRLVIGVENNGEANAYPIEFLAYHHQIKDSIGGKPVIITYCSVCRTGRVFEPIVNGHYEQFRLVGMDHFNAMFEDKETKSWWRQVNGEAIAGKLKGTKLPVVESQQMTIDKWFELYPDGKVMQPDETFTNVYDSLAKYEQGKSKSNLTRTDSLSWKEKSWVVGLETGNLSKAYDWNYLKAKRIINDTIGNTSIVLALSKDEQSFVAFERQPDQTFTISDDDMLHADSSAYDFSGRDLSLPSKRLKHIPASQEFWHSWLTFHPSTRKFK